MIKIICLAICFAATFYTCDAACTAEAAKCVQGVTTVIAKDPEDTDKVCNAYNDMKDCFQKAGCDIEKALKDMPPKFKDLCPSSGATQVSFIVSFVFLACLASFFTK